ncbi:hypothetical protein [Sulfurimonas sp.]|uniref:hypothetical protein n=1 Tax=Sulfurimonas sp. TaxID=2022749 RepID=UPI003D0AEACF
MKHILGKFLLLFLFGVHLFANSNLAEYSIKADKTKVYLKEAVLITFKAKQRNHSENMFFFLEAKKSPDYQITLLQKKEVEVSYHNKEASFTFLLFPLKSGKISVNFDFIAKQASDDAVAQIYEGSRDNQKWMETIDTNIPLKPLSIDVIVLENEIQLVGDFNLTSELKGDHVDAYDNANIIYTLQGKGFNQIDIHPIQNIDQVKIFEHVQNVLNQANNDGYTIVQKFNYALISQNDITIPSREIKCFSPSKQKYYSLHTQKFNISVQQADKSELLDDEEYPKTELHFEKLFDWLIYMVIFLSGFISAKLLPKRVKKAKRQFEDIKDAKTPHKLLLLLLDKYNPALPKEFIDQLELLMKTDDAKQFDKLKQKILEQLQ